MNKKYSAFRVIARIYKMTLSAVPFSGISGAVNYLIQGFFPAITSLILVQLFNKASLLSPNGTAFQSMLISGFLFVISYAFVYIFQFIASITINAGIYERCTSYYQMKITEKAARLPLIDFENAEILNFQHRARDCVDREILSQIYMSTTVFITSGLSIVSTMLVLAAFSPWFLLISFLSVLPYFAIRLVRGKEFYYLKQQQAPKKRRLDYLWHLFTNKQVAREMQVMGFDGYLSQIWKETRDEVNEELWQQELKDAKSLFWGDLLKIAGYAASIVLALVLTLNHQITIGVFGASIAAFVAMQEATKSFLIDLGNLPENIAFANDYFAYLDLPEEDERANDFQSLKQKISVEHLSFSYPNSLEDALHDISFTLNKGEKAVILGVNGSGKTTLIKCLLGLYPLKSGNVYYDGLPVEQIATKPLFAKFSLILQDFTTYHLSLRENVAISGLSNLTNDEKLIDTLQSIGFDLDSGNVKNLEQQLGREFNGIELSGGQSQKLAIARALFKESELIILDEPTSALDPMAESEILNKFIEIAKDKTAIIISHRVGLCQLADKILVMKNGQICENGTHQALMANKGEYYKLYSAQEQWYK